MTAERLAILLMTFGVKPSRQEYARRTVAALCKNLVADNLLGWYIADAGSPIEFVNELAGIIHAAGQPIIGQHNVWASAGENWNAGHEACFRQAEVVLHVEDDFELTSPLDVRNYQAILEESPSVGVIRLGLLPIELRGRTVGARGEIFLNIDKGVNYAWSGNPCLMHRRWWTDIGQFPVGLTAGQTEVVYDNRLRGYSGRLDILRPVNLGSYSPFAHIGEEKA